MIESKRQRNSKMNVHQTSFSGQMLERGFWLYVWRIKHKKSSSEYWYIGRTGDSSSANASSPIGRLSQHLNLKENAKGNSLVRNIKKVGLEPEECQFKLVSIGPIYPEQDNFDSHVPFRDNVAKLEAEVAYVFRSKGKAVLGNHPRRGEVDRNVLNEILQKFHGVF